MVSTRDNRPFSMYAYAFALDAQKTVQSLKLPNNPLVKIASISELARASCSAIVFNKIVAFGTVRVRPFSSARLRAARATAFRTGTVSRSRAGGSIGRSL